jgi:hypothetical protein
VSIPFFMQPTEYRLHHPRTDRFQLTTPCFYV